MTQEHERLGYDEMDIAEIRKKARSAKPATPPVEEEASVVLNPDEGESATEPVEEFDLSPGDELAEESVDLAVEEPSEESAPADLAQSDALDRLFGEDLTAGLATDEDYQETLLAQGVEEQADLQQYLSFQLGLEEYALDITQISEIIKYRPLTEIPRVPDFILGIISLRGVVVPIFDLKKRFTLGAAELTSASRIVVCRHGEMTAGLLVDRINQVITISEGSMEPPPAVLSGIDRELVRSVGRFQGRMVIVLQLSSVLDVELT